MDNIHYILNQIESISQSVLATIIHVEGSAYRKEGTTMLIRKDGTRVGVLTGGCLENDLMERAKDIFLGASSQICVYDMRPEDDVSWGRGAGCNGKIHVLLELVDDRMVEQFRMLKKNLDMGKHVTLVKLLADPLTGNDVFIQEDGAAFGGWKGNIPLPLINMTSRSVKSGTRHIPGYKESFYVHRFTPKPRLVIFGAGPDARPLADFAAKTGFAVIVSDWRPALCSKHLFPDAEELLIGFPNEIIPHIIFRPADSVIVMTRDFKRDKELLTLLRKKKLRYLGLLGSKLRTLRLLETDDMPERIRSPVGIPIGAEGPEEIAISILADVIKNLRNDLADSQEEG